MATRYLLAVMLVFLYVAVSGGQEPRTNSSRLHSKDQSPVSEGPGWPEFQQLSQRLERLELENARLRSQQFDKEPATHDSVPAGPVEQQISLEALQDSVLSARSKADGDLRLLSESEPTQPFQIDAIAPDLDRFNDRFYANSRTFDVGLDLYSLPEFEGGLIVSGRDVAMKIGGLVKADYIYDFDPIDATDSFVTTTIPVGAAPRTNSRFHARQTRLSFDTRWAASDRTIRIFVESDFFGKDDHFRLRHAYGEVGSLLVGKTSTTFHDIAASPATLDFEGSVSSVNRRQAQARWTRPIGDNGLTAALAIEDARFIIQVPPDVSIEPRTPSPDFVGHLRLERPWGRFQLGGLYRIVGVQPTGDSVPQLGDRVYSGDAWGLNFVGVVQPSIRTKAYYQFVFGEGIGSYRGLPDAAPTGPGELGALPMFGWMVGTTHDWNDRLSSNFTYAENSLENSEFQDADDVHRTTYLAANLIWQPLERVNVGIEYLYGIRENIDRAVGAANRIQFAFIFDLP